MIRRRDLVACLAGAGALALAPRPARAAAWPARPIGVVVPYPPGGSTDITARIVGERLSVALGQPLVIDNRSGAGGNLGMDVVARAAPDGYTLGVATTAHAINMTLFRKLNYDTLKSFAPVALLTENPLVLVVPEAAPWRDVRALIAAAKEKPGALNYASSGVGQSTHLAAELFAAMAGIKLTHIPYRGSAPAITDVIAGRVDLMFDTTQSVLSHVEGGRVRALGITSAERLPRAKDIPTIREAALPDYVAIAWNGLVAPRGTPADTVQRLNAEIVRALQEPGIVAKFEALGATTRPLSTEAFGAYIADEIAKWGSVVKQSGATLD
ncbi:Tripartite-type tricarboxylate transporter, receptor component TctC [Methylobacterium sp. ap11]|uniref:tripartite tricarboxylate transporter substrate binding protein n=1 Tax=Methylobacterium sp. ap11 TaxID=1761799 RepID=UPI0008D6D1C4|nr:tripartite tricarboxylate transporter substrate binding protein [Methylobacterium sp. ap11]SEO80799.1 Tripartite-type tricarboxylate transporter, receptor component TctC [Methylobacterium sp. ap11]